MNNEIKTFTPPYTSAYALNEGFCAYAISWNTLVLPYFLARIQRGDRVSGPLAKSQKYRVS